MTLRELIHEATQDWTLMDEPVCVWAYNAEGEFVRFEVTDLNVRGEPVRQVLSIEERPES
jgi:hypothetical protein